MEQVTSMTMAQQTDDIQSRLAAAAQPLDFSASLDVKFASYDNYCSLFHFILNSEGPVDLEPPSVRSLKKIHPDLPQLTSIAVLLGLGCHRRIHLPVQLVLLLPKPCCSPGQQRRRDRAPPRNTQHMGLLQRSQCPLLPHPEITDQRTVGCNEAQRGAYGSCWRLWLEAALPNVGILLYHWSFEGTLPFG